MFKAKLKRIFAVFFAAAFFSYLVSATLITAFLIALFTWETGVTRLSVFVFAFFSVPVAAGATACALYLKKQRKAAAAFFAWFFFMQLCFWGMNPLCADWNDNAVSAVMKKTEKK